METLVILVIFSAGLRAADAQGVTFYRDVLPILQERCQGCHRISSGPAEPQAKREERLELARINSH
jgi:hypothetical protein